MRTITILLLLASPALADEPTPFALRPSQRIFARAISDAGVVANVALTIIDDWRSEQRWRALGCDGLEAGGAALVSYTLSRLVRSQRPDATTFDSFPSRHSTIAASLASHRWQRVGWSMAVTVPLARLMENRHRPRDVIVGVSIGVGTDWLVDRIPACRAR